MRDRVVEKNNPLKLRSKSADLEKALSKEKYYLRTVFIGTYVPRRCGIATYTRELTQAINILNPYYPAEIMALDNPEESAEFPWEVKMRIRRDIEKDYIRAAEYLNSSSCDIVCLQHEYGIFGGNSGEYILTFARHLKKPLVVTFHTTLKQPNDSQKYILKKLAKKSRACVVMIKEADRRLHKIYKVPEEKTVVIHHGVPNIAFSPARKFKKKVKFDKDDFLVGSINLVSKNKGLEYVLESVAKVKDKIPNIKFLMIGQTHPTIKVFENEKYRKFLRQKAKKLGLGKDTFIEINKYLPLNELINFLKAMDIYITPYIDLDQTSSGTLAYALGAGKVCVSTPYIYAKEVLSKGRGILVPPRSSSAIAKSFLWTYNNGQQRVKMEKAAYKYSRKMIWYRVAMNYLNLFELVMNGKK
jgi:glycosyltransferase involved in cell wall biosynthesis